MYIFKNCESVIWCSLEIKEKSFIDLIKGVNLFPVRVVQYYTLKLSFNTYGEYGINKRCG